MGVTPKSSIYRWIFPYKPTILGIPLFMDPPYGFRRILPGKPMEASPPPKPFEVFVPAIVMGGDRRSLGA